MISSFLLAISWKGSGLNDFPVITENFHGNFFFVMMALAFENFIIELLLFFFLFRFSVTRVDIKSFNDEMG